MAPLTRDDVSRRAPARRSARAARGLAGVAASLVFIAAVTAIWLEATAPGPQVVVVAIPAPVAGPSASAPTAGSAAAAPLPPATAPPPASPLAPVVLTPAPDPELAEKTPDGPLPIVARDGRQAWQVYARPFDRNDHRPRVSIVISGLGLSKISAQEAIQGLPPEVALSFLPYQAIAEPLQQARAAGHETLLDLPMEPLDYPRQDPGPRALLVSLEPTQNLDRLRWMMSRATGYIGMATFMGSRFATVPDEMRPVLVELRQRGLALLDARATGDGAAAKLAAEVRLPRGLADRVIDSEITRTAIDRQLAALEDLARHGGAAIGIGAPYPVTIQTVAAWAAHLAERRVVLAPLSAVLVQ